MKKILVLPDAGPQNPFQYQMIEVLTKSGFTVVKSPSKRFFATLSAFRKHHPDVLYYDWIQSFILGKTLLITLLKCLCFYIEISYLTKVKKIPVVHTLHNMHNHAGLWLNIEAKVYTWFLQKCTKIRVYSEETKRKAATKFELNINKIYVIQDVPYHHYYLNNTTKTEGRRFLNISDDAFVFLFVGMLKPYKGLECLIEIFQQAAPLNSQLLIAGASDTPAYDRRIAELTSKDHRILFHNHFIDKDFLQYYMNAADVVVLPFKNIEHSGSVDLAMSFKKAVITLQTDHLKKVLPHQIDLLFESDNTLGEKLLKAQTMDLAQIGEQNYRIAGQSNYKDFILLFQHLQSR